MQRAGDKLLSRSILARDQNTSRRRGNFLDLFHQRSHHRTLPNDLKWRVDRLAESRILFLKLQVGKRVAQHHQDAVRIERLLQDLVGASLGRLYGRANRSVAADHHHERRRIQLANLLQRFHTVHASHFYIEKDEVRPPLLKLADAFLRTRQRLDLIPFVFEQLAERSSNTLLVVDDEYASAQRTLL